MGLRACAALADILARPVLAVDEAASESVGIPLSTLEYVLEAVVAAAGANEKIASHAVRALGNVGANLSVFTSSSSMTTLTTSPTSEHDVSADGAVGGSGAVSAAFLRIWTVLCLALSRKLVAGDGSASVKTQWNACYAAAFLLGRDDLNTFLSLSTCEDGHNASAATSTSASSASSTETQWKKRFDQEPHYEAHGQLVFSIVSILNEQRSAFSSTYNTGTTGGSRSSAGNKGLNFKVTISAVHALGCAKSVSAFAGHFREAVAAVAGIATMTKQMTQALQHQQKQQQQQSPATSGTVGSSGSDSAKGEFNVSAAREAAQYLPQLEHQLTLASKSLLQCLQADHGYAVTASSTSTMAETNVLRDFAASSLS